MTKQKFSDLDLAYAMDVLTRLTSSIDTYIEKDRWFGFDTLHDQIMESDRLIKKYHKLINKVKE
jgi:hypothetical protein